MSERVGGSPVGRGVRGSPAGRGATAHRGLRTKGPRGLEGPHGTILVRFRFPCSAPSDPQSPIPISPIPYPLSLSLSASPIPHPLSPIPYPLSPIPFPLSPFPLPSPLCPIPYPLSPLYPLSSIPYPLSHIPYPLSLLRFFFGTGGTSASPVANGPRPMAYGLWFDSVRTGIGHGGARHLHCGASRTARKRASASAAGLRPTHH